MKRFVVYGEGFDIKLRWRAEDACSLYGVVAEKCENGFFGLHFYGPAQDGERQTVAVWATNRWRFYRELDEHEEWAQDIREIYGGDSVVIEKIQAR